MYMINVFHGAPDSKRCVGGLIDAKKFTSYFKNITFFSSLFSVYKMDIAIEYLVNLVSRCNWMKQIWNKNRFRMELSKKRVKCKALLMGKIINYFCYKNVFVVFIKYSIIQVNLPIYFTYMAWYWSLLEILILKEFLFLRLELEIKRLIKCTYLMPCFIIMDFRPIGRTIFSFL